VQDPERHGSVTGASISRLESTELQTLCQPSNRSSTISHESCVDFVDGNYAAEDSCGMVPGTPLFGPGSVRHMPSAGVLEYHGRKMEGPSGLRTTSSSCNSTLNHEPGVEVIKNSRAAIERFSVSSGTTLAVDNTKSLYVHEVSVKDPLRSTARQTRIREQRVVNDA
jgi:hypothetical protein